jgi:hypothetical protein
MQVILAAAIALVALDDEHRASAKAEPGPREPRSLGRGSRCLICSTLKVAIRTYERPIVNKRPLAEMTRFEVHSHRVIC